MHIDELTSIAKHLTRSAICGVTKEQLLRTFKEIYNLNDDEVKALLILCNFKSAPKSIDYEYFYNNPLIHRTERINYPSLGSITLTIYKCNYMCKWNSLY